MLFVRGKLSLDEVSRLEAHLERCGRCVKLIAALAGGDAAEPQAHSAGASPDSSAFTQLLRGLMFPHDETCEPPVARERFGDYRVTGVLGRGAMGTVYQAVHDATGRSVAIKTAAARSPKLLSAMRQEIASLTRLKHPGVVALLESGVVDGDPWCAMELLEGRTLEGFMRELWGAPARERAAPRAAEQARPLTAPVLPAGAGRLEELLELFARLCAPLAFIHQAGIVHCDLKPANIFIRVDGSPVLMDFGLLSRAGGSVGRESLQVGGSLRGTIPYLSPELILGQIPDARADLYSLGCVLYEALTGRPPFVARTANAYLKAHLQQAAPAPSTLVSGVPPALDELLMSLLAKRASRRIGNASSVADALSELLERSPAPAAATRAEGPRRAPPYLFRPRLVGRQDIIAKLEALQREALNGNGQLVLVGGESGIGKTFLASELAQRASRAGFDVLTGECAPISPAAGEQGAGAALEPFRSLIQAAADRCRGQGAGAAFRLFGSARAIALLARFEPALEHLAPSGAPDVLGPLPSTAERERVMHALAELVERMAAERPLCLIVDDLQWADDLSLSFLRFLSALGLSRQRLLVLGFYRTDEAPAALAELSSAPAVRSLGLARLDLPALRTLVDDLLSDHPADEFVSALAAHSEGNPFFVAEYLRAAAVEGLLERTHAGWRLAPGAERHRELRLPHSLRALLERRLSLLSDGTQRVVEAAAVLGREFRRSMLQPLLEPGVDVGSAVDEMLECQVLERSSDDRLRFAHDKLREAAYRRLDAARRTSLHAAAARVIEAAFQGSAERADHYAELAYHLRNGAQAPRAIDHFEKAGQHALRSSANADAARFFRAAHELGAAPGVSVSDARRASWDHNIGDALLGVGDLAGSVRHLCASVRRLGYPMPSTRLGLHAGVAASTLRQAAHRLVPERWLRARAPERAAVAVARTYERLVQAYYYSGDYERLFLANVMTLNLAERQPPTPTLAAAYTNAAITASIIPAHRMTTRYFRLAEQTLARAPDPEVESYLCLLQSVYRSGRGDWSGALEANQQALDLADSLGFRRRWEEAAGVRAWLLARTGSEQSVDWARRLFESARRRGDQQMMSWGLTGEATPHLRRGEHDAVRRALEQHRQWIPAPSGPELVQTIGLQIGCDLAAGDVAAAAAAADQAAALVRRSGPIHLHCVDAYAAVAEARLAAWKSSRLKASRRAARRELSTLARAASLFPVVRPRERLLRGFYRHLSGDDGGACALWRESAACALRLQAPYDEGCALLALASHLPRGSREALGAQAKAKAAFSELHIEANPPLPVMSC